MADGNGANFVNKWWKVGAVAFAIIVAWTTLQLNVTANTVSLQSIDLELKDRGVRITTNEVNIKAIQQDIEEIKDGQKEILKELRR